MNDTNRIAPLSLLLGFLGAVLLATAWGSVVQTQFNLAALAGIGAEIPLGLRVHTTLADLFGGFSPTYAGYVVVPALLVAFGVAWVVAGRSRAPAGLWYALGGGLGILAGIPVVNFLAPVALLIGAARDGLCTVLMALGGAVAGLLFARFAGRSRAVRPKEPLPAERFVAMP